MHVRRLVTDLGARRHGVVTRSQLRRIGLSEGQIRSLLLDGTLLWAASGVYRCAGAPPTYEQRVSVAVATAGPDAVVSHRCAARLQHLGVPWFLEAAPEITVPNRTRPREAGRLAVVHRTRHLDRSDVVRVHGLPMTTPVRVAVDCAGVAGIDPDGYRALVDDVLFRFGTPRGLRDAWARSGRRSGLPWLDDALGPYVPGAPPDSPKEMSLARVCWAGGLPLPERQVTIVDPRSGSVVARCDLAYRDARIGLEYAGRRFHAPRHRADDLIRHELLEVLDWQILYAGKDELTPPGSTRFVVAVAGCLLERLPAEHPTRRSAARVLAQLPA
ncbi:MAG: hypothetical protein NVSMB12_02560 [Acidimicrobiales bacterium]